MLPIGANKFSKRAQIPVETLNKYYDEYTNSGNKNYWQLDGFIPNPAYGQESDVKVYEVIKKAGALAKTCFNFECLPVLDSNNNIRMINASGSIIFRKPGDKQASTVPIILQIEGVEKEKEYIRLSLRGAGNKLALKAFYNLTVLYIAKKKSDKEE